MNISENLIRKMVAEILAENACDFDKTIDKSGVLCVKTDSVSCEHFEQNGVFVKDIVTLTEAPRIGAGVMEVIDTSFDWKLSYDEFDYIIEGTLEIEIDGRVVTGNVGDIIYIPKDSRIKFKAKGKARFAYFVYPANWAEIK